MSTLKLSKTERICVRASTPVKQLLQEAARACHKNVSEFLLDKVSNAREQIRTGDYASGDDVEARFAARRAQLLTKAGSPGA